MNRRLTLGSLFDGIGGFMLAARKAGVQPVWSSEIEPFPIRVTEKRFPDVLQLGDVRGINGADIPAVDIITFGFPCQDVAVCGLRSGLEGGKRTSLFFEAVRIIKEMRQATSDQYPRFCVFENVPGLFTSASGRDYRPYSANSSKSRKQAQMSLCLRKGNGCPPERSWGIISPLPGVCWTRSTSESLRDASVSTLSSILEANAPAKLYLSQKACQGLLLRAEKRGKDIPAPLKAALQLQASVPNIAQIVGV